MSDHTVASPTSQSVTLVSRAGAAVIAALLGTFILFGVGFAQIPALHNAAHDARHSFAFPCH